MDAPVAGKAKPVRMQRSDDRPAVDRQAWLQVALGAAGVWLATRIAYGVFTYFTISLNTLGAFSGSVLRAWDQYDTHWYLLISRLGYFKPGASAFFPLYPGLIGGVSALLGHAQGPVWPAHDTVRLLVALGIANIFTLAGFVGLALLAAHEYGDEIDPSRVVLVTAAFPFGFFLAAAYSEGLFLAAAVFCLYCARLGAWKWAALAAFIAGLTRPTAVALVLPLAWEYGRQHGWWSRQRTQERRFEAPNLLEAFMVVGAAPAAIALYGAFLWQRFGTPLIWLRVQAEDWHRQPLAVWTTMAELGHRLLTFPPFSGAEAQLLLNLLPLLLCLLVILVAFRQMPFAFVIYTLGLCYLSVSSPILSKDELIESAGRFLTVAFPVFLILARWMKRWPVVGQAWVSAGFLLQAALMIAFFAGRWVA
jgi:hypothetical protein